MDRTRAFISYSSEEKQIGGRLKQLLIRYCGYDTFIAHDDILGSEIWEKEILHAIRNADFFIPLVSERFKNSSYTDQETGYAVCLKKKIIPIKLETINPYGFINKYQALQYRNEPTDNLFELAVTVAHIGLHYQPKTVYYKKSLQSLVHALCESSSFETTNTIIRIVSKCSHQFSKDQVAQIMRAMQANSQIIGAFALPELKRILTATYHCRID
ncbi:MAG: toll/interleukin-1 receptor domain-containing protein [Candidatus Gottesmanbacteria bacterium]|nr:toll/interleukin-1 receptor domain-containing protein [Candidatus Gottesmanbacteria bacterium]